MKQLIDLKEFTDDDIAELQQYIEVHVHHTILQRVYVLTEDPLDKARNFITIYRIINSCRNYVASQSELRNKIEKLLEEAKPVYDMIYPHYVDHESSKINYGKNRKRMKIVAVLKCMENNEITRKLIDAFLVFGEKIELNRKDDFIGIDLESDFGKESHKEIIKVIESEKLD